MFLTSAYLPHAIYSVAITSITIHLISTKRTITDDRARVAARISILKSVAKQLREDKNISVDEIDRLQRLARPAALVEVNQTAKGGIGWKEVFLGRKQTAEPEMSEHDRRDWETVKMELEKQK